MLRGLITAFFVVLGAIAGYYLEPAILIAIGGTASAILQTPWTGAAIGGVIFFIAGFFASASLSRQIHRSEEHLVKLPVGEVIGGVIGMVAGLVIGALVTLPLLQIPVVGKFLPVFVAILLAYIGFRIGTTRREEVVAFFRQLRQERKSSDERPEHEPEHREKERERRKTREADKLQGVAQPKVLDTSVIIDGRIADVWATGFLEGPLVIPTFVLQELQHIADSSDALKRNRGRRGLDILNKIRTDSKDNVHVIEIDYDDVAEVDSKLVRLAQQLNGCVVTNDFNLNKVCELQGVPVLNVNDLANAVKPILLPGEEITVSVIKEGKEYGQGVAYLDDGTMIVIEGGHDFIGSALEVMVTSVLQTSAGRMIFAKPKLLEKAL
ncbi:MAG: PIN/TRAM domain-containing protein [Firmicutes bacterium]|nr:PIN/TRAM domain-containing protein [Bacillota bacterium]